MMWFVICSIVIIVLGKFFWERHKLGRSILRRGGMHIVYKDLVDLLLKSHPKSKVFRESSTHICLGVVDAYTTTLFEVIENFSALTITYSIESQHYGKHKLYWEFGKEEDPEYILFKIDSNIEAYFIKVKLLPKQ